MLSKFCIDNKSFLDELQVDEYKLISGVLTGGFKKTELAFS